MATTKKSKPAKGKKKPVKKASSKKASAKKTTPKKPTPKKPTPKKPKPKKPKPKKPKKVSASTARTEPDPVRENAGFYPMTGAMLLWGRKGYTRGTADELLAFFDAAVKLSEHPEFRVVPAQDLSRFDECRRNKDNTLTWVVGIKVETALADDGPSKPISFEQIRAQQQTADQLLDAAFWQRVEDAFGDSGGLYGDVDGNRVTQNSAVLVPFGPLASGRVVFGTVVPRDTEPTGELAIVRGTDMEQGQVDSAVLGVKVAHGDDWDTETVDLSEAAHAERVAKVGSEGMYFVVARYD